MMKFCLKPLVIYKLSAGLMLVLIRSYQLHALRSLAARPPPYRAPREHLLRRAAKFALASE
jgi:hypothetical protein